MADADCLFCKIVAGEIPSTKVYEDDDTLAFEDVNPQAPTHVLVIPKQHFRDVAEIAGDAQQSAAFLAGIKGFTESAGLQAFRTVMNTGADVGQSVFHLHAHVLAGRPMGWPPG